MINHEKTLPGTDRGAKDAANRIIESQQLDLSNYNNDVFKDMEYIENFIAHLRKRDQKGITLKFHGPLDTPMNPTKIAQQLAAAQAELIQTEQFTDHGCDSLSKGRAPRLVQITRPEIKKREDERSQTD